MPPDTILVVPRKQAYSNLQIAWLNYVQKDRSVFLQHIHNSYKLGCGVVEIPIQANTAYKKGKATAKVNGYDPITKTVYKFHGCYWHGCRFC